MVKFAKWRAKQSFVRVSVCGVKVVSRFFPSGYTFNMLIEIWSNGCWNVTNNYTKADISRVPKFEARKQDFNSNRITSLLVLSLTNLLPS